MSGSAHVRPGLIALVGVGGAIGTAARYGLSQAIPSSGGWPMATFTANLLGALLLGALLETLVRRGPEAPREQRLRLGLGTGLLGGFTTFSSLAIEIERLVADGHGVLGLTYGLLSVVLGVGCCLLGVIAAARHHHWRSGRLPVDPDTARQRVVE